MHYYIIDLMINAISSCKKIYIDGILIVISYLININLIFQIYVSKNLSSVKHIKQSKRNWYHNRLYKSKIKKTTKRSILNIANMKTNDINIIMSYIAEAFSIIDKAVKRKVIHRNKAARKKSHLIKAFNKKYNEVHT